MSTKTHSKATLFVVSHLAAITVSTTLSLLIFSHYHQQLNQDFAEFQKDTGRELLFLRNKDNQLDNTLERVKNLAERHDQYLEISNLYPLNDEVVLSLPEYAFFKDDIVSFDYNSYKITPYYSKNICEVSKEPNCHTISKNLEIPNGTTTFEVVADTYGTIAIYVHGADISYVGGGSLKISYTFEPFLVTKVTNQSQNSNYPRLPFAETEVSQWKEIIASVDHAGFQ
jgi:hypothetical protein